ncbi:MAG: GNAT family N-acetyltransferase [Rhodanobacteraceae bacterium]
MNRLARSADLDAVFGIVMQKPVLRFLNFQAQPRDQFAVVFEGLIAVGNFFVHERDGSVVGFFRAARGEIHTRHVAYISLLAVDPALAGKGIGKAMMTQALARLREEGAMRVELGVESTNPRAIAFYRAFGFEIEGTLRKGYMSPYDGLVDDVIMGLLFE